MFNKSGRIVGSVCKLLDVAYIKFAHSKSKSALSNASEILQYMVCTCTTNCIFTNSNFIPTQDFPRLDLITDQTRVTGDVDTRSLLETALNTGNRLDQV